MQEGEGSASGSRRSSQELCRRPSMSGISEGQAAVELFFRLNHARQTVEYVRRQVCLCADPGDVLAPCCAPVQAQEVSLSWSFCS